MSEQEHDRIIGAAAISAFLGISESALHKRIGLGKYVGVIHRNPMSRRLWANAKDLHRSLEDEYRDDPDDLEETPTP